MNEAEGPAGIDRIDGDRVQTARVLIRTFPPNLNPNYGGILQAWALQNVLRGLGFDAWVDASSVPRENGPGWIKRVVKRMRAVKQAFARALPSVAIPKSWVHEVIEAELGRALLEFAPARIPMLALFTNGQTLDPGVAASFDAFIVGSDQVWRPEYMNVASNLFEFLDEHDSRLRLSYAASFGTDTPHFAAGTGQHLSILARRFAGLSVREVSGVEVARNLWGVHAEVHVDPTMLIERSEYESLASQAEDSLRAGGLVEYVLDQSPDTMKTVAELEAAVQLPVVALVPQLPRTYRDARAHPEMYRRPSVEAWLGAIGSGEFVVTDSYHGTVFAIVYNVPFLAVLNRNRGASRFESLLSTFGLQDRLVEPGGRVPLGLVDTPVDWGRVNDRLATERERSIHYLRESLLPVLDRRSESQK